MNSSLLKTVVGYSRFALEEERKHGNVIGAFFHVHPYKKFQHIVGSIEGMAPGS